MILRSLALVAVASTALISTGCAKRIEAPMEKGVCFAVAEQADHTYKFNSVKTNVQSLEYCAVELERMRLNFLRMGGNVQELTGAYQGRFIFLAKEGISTSEHLDGPRFMALVRYNGKLVVPGAVPQEP
jgi:hypothetical protein